MKNKFLLLALTSLFLVGGCASEQPKKTVLPWMKKLECNRAVISDDVNLSVDKLSLAQNKTGCYGSDKEFCDLRVYQIMVESFKHGEKGAPGYSIAWGPSEHYGNIRGIIDSLEYIKSVGVNTIWLTPIFETKQIDNQDITYNKLDATGYYTSDYFNIDPKFGTKKELKELVTKAHKMGIYVIFDGVLGHAKTNVITESPNGNHLVLSRNCRGLLGHPEEMTLTFGTCFDMKQSMPFLKEVVTYWIKELKIDGWRFDQAYQVAPEYWKEISDAVLEESSKPKNAYKLAGKKVQPLGYTVGEYWSDSTKAMEVNVFKPQSGITSFGFPTRAAILSVFALKNDNCSKDASVLNTALLEHNNYSQPAYLNSFLTNHDVLRLGDAMQRAEYEKDGVKGDSYYDAHQAALSFIASLSGPITLYYGDEYGDDLEGFVQQPSDCANLNQCDDHVSRTTGKIESLNDKELRLKNQVAAMLKLRDSQKALSRGERTHLYSDKSIYIDLKTYENENVLYVLNTSLSGRNVKFGADVLGKLNFSDCIFVDLITGDDIDITSFEMPSLHGKFINVDCSKNH